MYCGTNDPVLQDLTMFQQQYFNQPLTPNTPGSIGSFNQPPNFNNGGGVMPNSQSMLSM